MSAPAPRTPKWRLAVSPDTAPASSVPALTLTGVSKAYRVRGQRRSFVTAVRDVSFTIGPGAAVG